MKLLLFSSLLFLNILNSLGQHYYKLIDTSSVWFQESGYDGGGGGDGDYTRYFFETDTNISGIKYYRLHSLNQHYYWYYGPWGYVQENHEIIDRSFSENKFLREDTLSHQVFALEILGIDTAEILFYDFNLAIGDTLEFNSTEVDNIVTAIDSVLINGEYRRRFSISSEDADLNPYFYIIDGIGSSYGLVATLEPPFESGQLLHCFTQEGETTILDGWPYPYDSSMLCEFKTQVNISQKNFQNLILTPNPATDHILINSSITATGNFLFSIYNVSGILILSGEFSNQNLFNVNIEELYSGYYYIILNSENKSWQGSFIKQ